MASGISADPKMIEHVGGQFRPIAAYVYEIAERGEDRMNLLLEACGDDDMGKEIRANLHESVTMIEGAFGSIGAAIENTSNVMAALAAKLDAMERAAVSNVNQSFRR
jgi:hypothetical protein